MTKGNLETKVQKRKQNSPRDNNFQYLAIFPLELFKIIQTQIHIFSIYLQNQSLIHAFYYPDFQNTNRV